MQRKHMILAMAALACLGQIAQAQDTAKGYPNKAIKIVVAGPAAGGSDIMARIIAAELGPVLGQPVIVENRAGAGGIIGTKSVADSPSDGYTLLLGHVATNAIVPALIKPKPYDAVDDFEPVIQIGTAPDLLVVSAKTAPNSLSALLDKAKAGQSITYGSTGVGMPQHVHGYLLGKASGADLQHIPYRGSAPALIDVISGQVGMMFVTPGAVVPFIKSGQIKALAVASAERSRFLPEVPTLKELGFPNVPQKVWFGVMAPARTPKPIVNLLNTEIAKILSRPEVRAKIEALYVELAPNDKAENFRLFVKAEFEKWNGLIKKYGITAE